MRKIIKNSVFLTFMIFLSFPLKSRADLFGGDVLVLTQILANAIKQLVEMQQIVKNGQDALGILQDVNRGINDSLKVIDSLGPYIDPGLYHDLKKTVDIVGRLHNAYGVVTASTEQDVQQDTDTVVAESLNMNNQLYDYSKDLDSIAETIKGYSANASPGVATKLTAQSLGVLVHVMSRQVQAQGQSMKIQAQALAVSNKREKDETRAFLDQANVLDAAMKNKKVSFDFPRF